MSSSVYAYTPNLGLKLIDYTKSNWNANEYDNLYAIDAILGNFTGLSGVAGVWAVATAYTEDQKLVDDATGVLYTCLVTHTSSSTLTFAQDRAANPSYWESTIGGGGEGTPQSSINFDDLPFITAAGLGLIGDGETDDAEVLQDSFDEVQASGIGRVYTLRADTGSFFFNRPLVVPTHSLVIFYSPILAGDRFRMGIRGDFEYSGDALPLTANMAVAATTFTLSALDAATLAVGDYVHLTGEGGGIMPFHAGQLFRLSAIAGTTLTVSKMSGRAFNATYTNDEFFDYYAETDVSQARRVAAYPLTGNANAEDATVTISPANALNIAVGDYVMGFDTRTVGDITVADATNWRECSRGIYKVTVVNTGTGVITFDRNVSRTFLTAHNAGIALLAPRENSIVVGANVTYTEAAKTTSVHTFHVYMGVASGFVQCNTLEKLDGFGHRGDAFRIDHSLECFVKDSTCGPANWSDDGECYGFTSYYSTDCFVVNCIAHRRRHGYLDQGSTRFRVVDSPAYNSGASDFDVHGCNEVGTTFLDCEAVGGDFIATGISIRKGLSVGAAHRGGSSQVMAHGLQVRGYGVSGEPAIYIGSQVSDLSITSFSLATCFYGILFTNPVANETSDNIRISNGRIISCNVAIFTNINGSSVQLFSDVDITGVDIRDCADGVHLKLTELKFIRNSIIGITHTTYTDSMALEDCAGPLVKFNEFADNARGIRLTDCVGAIVTMNSFDNLSADRVLYDHGGNTNARFLYNDTSGVSGPTIFTDAVSTGIIAHAHFTGDVLTRTVTDTVAPTGADIGFGIGCRWIDTTGQREYVCLDSTGTAVWTETTQTSAAGAAVFPDNTFRIQDNVDATKQLAFDSTGIATATTRTITMPDANVTLGDLALDPAYTVTNATAAITVVEATHQNKVINCTSAVAVVITLNTAILTPAAGQVTWFSFVQTGAGTLSMVGTASFVDVTGARATTGIGQEISGFTFDGTTIYVRAG